MCDEDATLELRVKTVKYFRGIQHTMKTKGTLMTGDQNAPLTHAAASARASRAATVMSELAKGHQSTSLTSEAIQRAVRERLTTGSEGGGDSAEDTASAPATEDGGKETPSAKRARK